MRWGIQLKNVRIDEELLFRLKGMFDRYNDEIVYVSGSLIEGFGNRYSDVDVFILTDKEFANLGFGDELNVNALDYKSTNSIIIDGTRFDVEVLSLTDVRKKIEKINQYTHTPDNNVFQVMWFNYVDILHKLMTGIPIFQQQKFNDLVETIDREKINKLISAMHLLKADGFLEDVRGTYEDKDCSTMYFTVHFMLHCLLKAYLSFRGYTNPNPKWIIRALNELSTEFDKKILTDYISIIEYDFRMDDVKPKYDIYIGKVLSLYHTINNFLQENYHI